MWTKAQYDPQLINEVIEKFKARSSDKPLTILFDADNTLYRFSTYREEHDALSRMYTKGFFKMLSIFEEAPIVIEALQRAGIKCGIISTLVDSPYCEEEKRESFRYYFPMIPDDMVFLVPPGTSKTDLFDDISNMILVDDFRENIIDWYKAGGFAVKKAFSRKKRPVPSINSLVELFPLLIELNALERRYYVPNTVI